MRPTHDYGDSFEARQRREQRQWRMEPWLRGAFWLGMILALASIVLLTVSFFRRG